MQHDNAAPAHSEGKAAKGVSRSTPRRRWTAHATMALLFGLVFLVGWTRAWPVVGLHHDDGVYLVTARALAEGHGYRLLQLPGEPTQTKYPILFPALLAVVWKVWPVFPDNIPALRCVTVAAGALAACLLWLTLVRARLLPAGLAFLVVAAGCTVPHVTGLLPLLMSEGPFLLASAVAVWLLWTVGEGEPGPGTPPAWAAGAALAACALVRSIGVAFLVGGLLYLWRRRRLTAGASAAAVTPVAAWVGWQLWFGLSGHDVYDMSYVAWMASIPLTAFPAVVRDNILSLLVGSGFLVAQSWISLVPVAARPLLSLALALWLGAASVWAGRRVAGPLPWLLAPYFAVTMAWPWPSVRFVAIVLPLVFALAASGCWNPSATEPRRRLATMCLTVFLASNLAYAAAHGPSTWEAGIPDGSDHPPRWAAFLDTFAWLREHTPRDAVVASVVEPMVYLYSGRQGVFPYDQNSLRMFYTQQPSIGTPDEMLSRLRRYRVRYLLRLPVLTWPQNELFQQLVGDAKRASPSHLRRVYAGDDERFEILEIVP